MIGQHISHYRIVEKLGEGGMGVVYVAEDTLLPRRVAIKFLPTDRHEHHYRARFLQEARAASTLNHEHIATIYEYGKTPDDEPYIVMELINGQDLSALLHQGKLTLARALEIVEDIAEALEEAHAHGIVHRDIKPSNVMVNKRGRVKVLDFGLAKQLVLEKSPAGDPDAQTLLATRTQSGAIIGTPLYLSPEQATGAPVDARSDIFALGALLYECLAGRPAFSGATVIEICAQVLHVEPPPPSTFNQYVTPELDRITLKALAKKTEARYQSATELISDLRAERAAMNGHSASLVLTKTHSSVFGTSSIKALSTLSETFRRPRLSLRAVLLSLAVILLGVWGVTRLYRATPHQPTPEALRWYEEGTNALRDGTYYKASKALERAVAADDKFALAHARLAEAWTELDYADKAKDEIIRVGLVATDRASLPPLESLYLQAVTGTVSRDFAGAIESYTKIMQQLPDAEKSYAALDLGRAFEKNGDVNKAIENYSEAANRNPQYAAAFLRAGILYGRKQNLAAAIASFDKAESLYQTLNNFEGVTEVCYQRGVLFNDLDKSTEAEAQLQKSLELSRVTANTYQQIKSLLQLSSVACTRGKSEEAQSKADVAIKLAVENGIENLATDGLIDLGNSFFGRGDYEAADKYFQQALSYAQRFQGRRNEARARLSLGSLRMSQSNADEAIEYIKPALVFYQQGNYRQKTSQAAILLGRANRDKGDYESALQAFTQELQLAEQIGDPSQVLVAHNDIGNVLAHQERYPEALGHFEECYRLSSSLNNQLALGRSLLNRGDALWRMGLYTQAQALIEKAFAPTAQPVSDKSLLAEVHQVKAEMNLSARHLPEASAEITQALNLAGTQYREVTVQAKLLTCLLKIQMKSPHDAVQPAEEAVALATQMKNQWLISKALLAQAEAQLENDDAPQALANALRAQEIFARSGQQESEWRAWLIAARASQRIGDASKAREYLANASNKLNGLEQRWGSEAYSTYLNRADILALHQLLQGAEAASQSSLNLNRSNQNENQARESFFQGSTHPAPHSFFSVSADGDARRRM